MAGDDHSAGYRRPPKANRFKKGVSGNPQGRPRMSRDLCADIYDELAEPIEIKDESGRVLAISKQRALVKALVGKALSGDIRAATTLFSLTLRRNGQVAEAQSGKDAEDVALLQDYEAHEEEQR
jgi:hypothetical protein